MRYNIESKMTSESIQKSLLKMGIYWCGSGNEVITIDKSCICVNLNESYGIKDEHDYLSTSTGSYEKVTLNELRKIIKERNDD